MLERAKRGTRPGNRHLAGTLLLSFLVSLASPIAPAAEPAMGTLQGTLDQAQALLAGGQSEAAWALLAPLEIEAGGNSGFDYLYGIAALDTGRQAAAITALLRVLAREPDFAGARMELARARYEAGDYPAAEAQFRYLLTQSPPADTRAVIGRYLQAIDQGAGVASAGRSRFVPYAEIGAGWDSNANASTSSDTFGVFVLDPDNVETDSSFVQLAGGFQHSLAAGADGAVLSSGRSSYRWNPDADFVNQALVSLATAGYRSWGSTRGSLGVSGYYGWLDGDQHDLGGGVDLGLTQRFGANWELGSQGRAGVVRYQQDELEILDVTRYLGSVTLARSNIGSRNGRAGVTALFGTDDAEDDASPYSNDRIGGRAFVGWRLATGSTLFAEAAYQETDFDDSPGFFGVDRLDEQWTVAVSTDYRDWPARGYSLAPTLRFTSTDSTVSLYDYDRFELGVYLRRSKR